MRVLLVAHRYPPDGVGGVERYVEAVARELAALGDDVHVLTRTPTHLPRRPVLRTDADGRVHRIVGSGVRLDEPLARNERLEELVGDVLRICCPDVVHVNHLLGLPPRLPVMAASRRIPVLVTLHDFYFACPLLHLEKRDGRPCDGPDGGRECALTCFARGRGARAGLWTARAGWFEHLLETCSGLLAPSADVAGYFERHTRGRPVSVLENGVFFGDRPTPRGASRETLRLAVLGAVLPHKGAHTVVAALGGLGLPVELTLHGPTPDRRYARRLVADARTDPLLELHLAGPYEPAELPSRLDGVDVVVVASQVREGSPLAPREALALGIPVVASRVGGLTELVSHELNGLLFDPRDPRGLPDALRRIASDPDLRTRLAAGARNTAVRRLADHVVELREVYARALPAEVDDATADRLFAPLRSGAAT